MSVFMKPSPDGMTILPARKSISAILLVAAHGTESVVYGILHPEPRTPEPVVSSFDSVYSNCLMAHRGRPDNYGMGYRESEGFDGTPRAGTGAPKKADDAGACGCGRYDG